MSLDAILDQARQGRLYPAVILYGGELEERQEVAVRITRTLLCERSTEARPCDPDGDPCRHCRRIGWPGDGDRFHADLHVLERDLRTVTSTAATRELLAAAYAAPYEARGQVFVVAEADTLSPGGADALLKMLEEPPTQSPRHFLLLAASRLDLPPTLRSRSLAVFLGGGAALDPETVEDLAAAFGESIDHFFANGAAVYLLTAAQALGEAPGWNDPRARRPWALAAAAVVRYLEGAQLSDAGRGGLLAFAAELLDGPRMRVRSITAVRVLEGLLARHLTG